MKKCFATKLLLVMRICVVQGLIVLLISMSCLAHTGFAQLLNKPVTVHLSDVPFVDALKEIGESANIRFVYSADQLTSESNVSLTAKQMPLRQLLEELLDPREITYKVHEREASITLRKRVSETPVRESHDRQGNVHRKVQQITGQVTDGSTALPMPGVNILVKGTLTGTTTDNEGQYVIEANENDILVFSFIGYAPVEALVGKRTTIDITLSEDIMRLQDVVINAGYWEVKDQERTGNISKVDAATIEKQPINNPLQALQGRMTGVYIQQNTGVAGGGFDIQIRGRNSLRTGSGGTVNGNLPLYIIDGIPFTSTSLNSTYLSSSNLYGGNPLSAINPSDIESIEILKDADATAIYGSRGANGVVLITTKKAKAGKTKFDINVSRGIGQVSNKMKLLSTAQYLEMRMEGLENDGYTSLLEDPQYDVYWPDLKIWDQTRETDWQETLIGGTADITNAQLSLSGGNSNTQFLVSGGYYGESTVFPGDANFQRGSARVILNHSSEDGRLKLSSSVNFTTSTNKLPTSDFTSMAVTLPPNAPALHTSTGELNWENGTWRNPLSILERKYSGHTDNLVMNATVSYELLPGLEFKSSVGATRMQVNEVSVNPLISRNPADRIGQTGSSNFGEGSTRTWIAEPQLSYSRKLGSGNLVLLGGASFQQSIQQGKTIEATGFSSDALLENIDAATTVSVLATRYSQYRYAAAFARVNYNLDGKYIINLTGRRDGSSRFGPGNRFANFGAVGAAWIFSEENWLKDHFNILSFGKLRASYGTTGSDAIGDYQFLDTFTPTANPYNSTGGLYASRLSNPDYSWETNRKAEIGMELGFFQDRVSFSGAYYRNRSSNQLVGLPLPVLTGQSSIQFNLPATVENTGFELQLTTLNVSNTNIEWTTDLNITIPNNRLVEFPELEKFSVYRSRYDVGKSLFIYKAYEYEGVDSETGLYRFKDLNGDGTLSSAFDYVGLKEIAQEFYGGINNTLRFKGIQLDVFIQFVKQTGRDYMDAFPVPGNLANQPDIVMSRWRAEGDQTDIQRFTVADPSGSVIRGYSYYTSSSHAITDASFVRLRNVSLSWDLPRQLIQKVHFDKARLYIQGQNLMTLKNYRGLDPETMTSASLPPLRIFSAGINFSL